MVDAGAVLDRLTSDGLDGVLTFDDGPPDLSSARMAGRLGSSVLVPRIVAAGEGTGLGLSSL